MKIVAIDGPSGSGKSTLAKELANKLKWVYVDTGAMYRSFTWLCMENNIGGDDSAGIAKLLTDLEIFFENTGAGQNVYINKNDVTEAIRTKKVTSNVSSYAALPQVREKITALIRRMGEGGSIILDGRDIGTVVFPEAKVKLFLIADSATRARRRMQEMKENVTFEEVLASIEKRDDVDSKRANAPLKKADDAIVIDTAKYTISEMTEKAFEIANSVF